MEFAPQQLPQPHCLNVVLFSLTSCEEKEEVKVINHHKSLGQAEATVGKGTDGRAVLTRTMERCASAGKAQPWGRQEPGKPTYSFPNISHCPSRVTLQAMRASASAVFQWKRQKTLELCLCQDRCSSTPLKAQLSLNTFNLPRHAQGTGKKNFCKASSTSIFQPYGSPNHSLVQAKPHTRTQLLCDSLHQPQKVQGCKATTRMDHYDLIPQGWVLPGAEG